MLKSALFEHPGAPVGGRKSGPFGLGFVCIFPAKNFSRTVRYQKNLPDESKTQF